MKWRNPIPRFEIRPGVEYKLRENRIHTRRFSWSLGFRHWKATTSSFFSSELRYMPGRRNYIIHKWICKRSTNQNKKQRVSLIWMTLSYQARPRFTKCHVRNSLTNFDLELKITYILAFYLSVYFVILSSRTAAYEVAYFSSHCS